MNARRMIGVLGLVGVGLGLSVSLVFGHGGDPNMVHACVNTSSGTVKFVSPNTTCQNNELAVDWDKPLRTEPGTFIVDCDAQESINNALRNLIPGDTLRVSGTCNENVRVHEEVERITLDGQGIATINGPDSTLGTVEVRGRAVTIRNFTITGGDSCVRVTQGGTATIDSNHIQNSSRLQGISITRGSFATIANNTIKNNANHGIQLLGGSSANIGFLGSDDAMASPNVIQNNAGFGINLSDASSARIDGNLITDNAFAGINVSESSSARIGFTGPTGSLTAANTIKNNGNGGIRALDASHVGIEGNFIESNIGVGISIDTSSSAEIGVRGFSNNIQNNTGGGVLLRRSSSARILAAVISNNTGNGVHISRGSQGDVGSNTINANTGDGIRVEENGGLNIFPSANNGNNGQFGVRCLTGGYATGSLGGLTGASGPKNFGITVALTENPAVSVNSEGCIDRTTP